MTEDRRRKRKILGNIGDEGLKGATREYRLDNGFKCMLGNLGSGFQISDQYVKRPYYECMFLTRDLVLSDYEMNRLGIDMIYNGARRLDYDDKQHWSDQVIMFMREIVGPLVRKGYKDDQILIEGIRRDNLYTVSMLAFRGNVERKLFMMDEWNQAENDGERMLKSSGMLPVMN